VIRDSDLADRAAGSGAESGSAIVHRCAVSVSSWVEMAEAMMSMLSRKVLTSPERMSRSVGEGIWPVRRADTRSVLEWSESGRVRARGGSVDSVSMRIWVDKKVERAVVRLCSSVSAVHDMGVDE
jgi:hypothetical protein